MRLYRYWWLWGVVGLVIGLWSEVRPAVAQGNQEPSSRAAILASPPPVPGVNSFFYDPRGRRDPFVPLGTTVGTRPTPQTLSLKGILWSGPQSLAIFQDPSGRGYFLRQGEALGAARIVEIRPDAVVLEFTGGGISRREVLRLRPNERKP